MKSILNKKSNKFLLTIVLAFMIITVLMAACSVPIEKKINQPKVNDFYLKAIAAVKKYGDEPVSGEIRPFPAGFRITGKALWIEVPLYENTDPSLPAIVYDNYSLSDYIWYTDKPADVRYVILIDRYYSPSDEYGSGDSLIFTIVDLSYNEMVYKSFISGFGKPPFKELAELLSSITL